MTGKSGAQSANAARSGPSTVIGERISRSDVGRVRPLSRRETRSSITRRDYATGAAELLIRVDRYDLPSTHALVRHDSVNTRVERVVAAAADVATGMNARAALTHQNRASGHFLPAEALHAEALRIAVPAVSTGANAFLVCHEVLPVYASWLETHYASATSSILISVKFCRWPCFFL